MTAIYDRRSGQTHVVNDVVPTVLAALADGPLDGAALAAVLGAEGARLALDARLAELVATGLIDWR